VDGLCGAAHGERNAARTNHRNGYRARAWETRAGAITLPVPKLRQGSYPPFFLEPRRTAEKALVAVIQEADIQGISTRSVDDPVKAMGMTGISKSQVSRLHEGSTQGASSLWGRVRRRAWAVLESGFDGLDLDVTSDSRLHGWPIDCPCHRCDRAGDVCVLRCLAP